MSNMETSVTLEDDLQTVLFFWFGSMSMLISSNSREI